MIWPIYSRDKKFFLKKDMATKIKLIDENIRRGLTEVLKSLEVIRLYRTSSFHRVTNKIKKKMKYGVF